MTIDAVNFIDGERDYFEWKHRQARGLANSGFDIDVVCGKDSSRSLCVSRPSFLSLVILSC